MGAGVSQIVFGGVAATALMGKTRAEILEMCFRHLDKDEEDFLTLANMMCIIDELTPSEIEGVRQDFIKIDRKEKGVIELEDFIEYYTNQLADASEEEFRIFCEAILNSTHWSHRKLEQAGIFDIGDDSAKKEKEREILLRIQEEQRLEEQMLKVREQKKSLKRVHMIAKGEGSMVEWPGKYVKEKRHEVGRLKARMMMLGHFAASHKKHKNARSAW